jgi:hypothetical protein
MSDDDLIACPAYGCPINYDEDEQENRIIDLSFLKLFLIYPDITDKNLLTCFYLLANKTGWSKVRETNQCWVLKHKTLGLKDLLILPKIPCAECADILEISIGKIIKIMEAIPEFANEYVWDDDVKNGR